MSYDDNAWGVVQRGTNAAGCTWFAATASTQAAALPTAWGKGSYWLEVTAKSNCRYLFSDTSAAAVSLTDGSATGATGTTIGGLLLANVPKHMKVPDNCTYFAFITESGTCGICAELRSSPTATP